MERFDLADFLLIAEAATDTPAEELQRTINVALAEAALAAPFAGIVDTEFFPAPHEKIAVLGYRIASYHPLPDGNKRAAWASMRMMAALNGHQLHRPAGGEDEIVDVITAVAAGQLAEHDFATWVGGLLQPE